MAYTACYNETTLGAILDEESLLGVELYDDIFLCFSRLSFT